MTEQTTTETTNEDVSGLKAKQAELLAKLKKAQDDLAALQTEKESAEEEAARKKGDLEALEKRLTDKFQKQLDAEKARADAAEAGLRTIRVDNAITTALSQNDVVPEALDALSAFLKSKTEYQDGEATIEGKPIADFVAGYVSSKQGALFRRAANNTGADAEGSGTTKATTFTRADILGSRNAEFLKFAAENPAEAKSIAEQAGLKGIVE